MFTALKPNLDGYKFMADYEAETFVTRRTTTNNTDWYQQRTEKVTPRYDIWDVAVTMWKCTGIAKQVNMSCFYWRWK